MEIVDLLQKLLQVLDGIAKNGSPVHLWEEQIKVVLLILNDANDRAPSFSPRESIQMCT